MGAFHDLLRDDESLELETRRHPGGLLNRLLQLVSLLAVVSWLGDLLDGEARDLFLSWGTVLVVVVFGGRALLAALRWAGDRFVVTDRRILAATGLVRRRVTSLPGSRIRDVWLERSLLGRLVGYGDVVLELEDRRLRLLRLPEPKRFLRATLGLLDAHSSTARIDDEDTGPLPRVPI